MSLFKFKKFDEDKTTCDVMLTYRELKVLSHAMQLEIEDKGRRIDEAWKDCKDGSYGMACDYELRPREALKKFIDDLTQKLQSDFFNDPNNLNPDYRGENE